MDDAAPVSFSREATHVLIHSCYHQQSGPEDEYHRPRERVRYPMTLGATK